MRPTTLLFEITTIAVFIQLILGGLLTFSFIDAGVHIVTGLLVFVLAIATLVLSLVSKPKSRPLQATSAAMVVLIVVQIILGFNTLASGSQLVAWLHFVNAMLIYGAAISGTFLAMRLDRTANVQTLQQKKV